MSLRYNPVEDGFEIVGGNLLFNRPLYGGHDQDDLSERYFTFAGDKPIVMGSITDWKTRADCTMAKCGVFMAGLAFTPGIQIPSFCYAGEKEGDRHSFWFHENGDNVSIFRNGWMEYDIRIAAQCFPRSSVFMEVLPLQDHAGFAVNIRVESEQQVHLAIGLGAVTDFLGRLDCSVVSARNFQPDHCRNNKISCGNNSALLEGDPNVPLRTAMRIGSSFPVDVSIGDAALVANGPGMFLSKDALSPDTPMVKMTCRIEAGKIFEGFFVVLRNAGESVLESYLSRPDLVDSLKKQIAGKRSAITINTPDKMLDLATVSNIITMDSCWHEKAFCHGAVGWHCPYMGWRNWYGPTVLGWHDRVGTAFKTHASTRVKTSDGSEKIVYSGPDQYSRLSNSYGFIPEIPDGRKSIFYNMQEVGVDMFLHHLEWTGDLKAAAELFDAVSDVLDWEERIFDPDGDGLYQNFLNTWISDAHSYNGGGCAQSSSYNLRANRLMGIIAGLLKRDPSRFERRVAKIENALQSILWLPGKGVLAEYVDTLGRNIIHDSPELATVYHAIECSAVDHFQAYQMLRFTETEIRSEQTVGRGGRLAWSSNWYPQNYSSCGLYPAENLHLAWAYFVEGFSEKGWDILNAVVDSHFIGSAPGSISHCATGTGYTLGTVDFSEVSSLYLRAVVEGVFGIRFNLLEKRMTIANPELFNDFFKKIWKVSVKKLHRIPIESFRLMDEDLSSYFCIPRAILDWLEAFDNQPAPRRANGQRKHFHSHLLKILLIFFCAFLS